MTRLLHYDVILFFFSHVRRALHYWRYSSCFWLVRLLSDDAFIWPC